MSEAGSARPLPDHYSGGPRVEGHLVLVIVALLLGFAPLSLYALYCHLRRGRRVTAGDLQAARLWSRRERAGAIAALVTQAVLVVMAVLVVLLWVAVVGTSRSA